MLFIFISALPANYRPLSPWLCPTLLMRTYVLRKWDKGYVREQGNRLLPL